MDSVLIFNNKTLSHVFENSPKGFKLLDGWLRSLHIEQVHACLEATGPYSEPVAEFLYEKKHRVSLVNPLRIKGFAKSDLKRNKTDAADARLIADFCLVKDPEDWHPLPSEVKYLQTLTRRIEVLEKILASERNRLESAPRDIRSSLKRMIRGIEKEIDCQNSATAEFVRHCFSQPSRL